MDQNLGDLLFGLLAAQFKGLSAETVEPAVDAWKIAPHIALWQHFIETGVMEEEDVRFVDRLAEALIHQHGGAEQALEEFGGVARAEELLGLAGETLAESSAAITKQAPPTFFQQLEQRYEGLPRVPGRYTLVKEHARGGMGRVLVVHDERLDRQVAMKELLTETDYVPEPTHPSPRRYTASMAARFIREAQVAGRLEHPSIVPVYELGQSEDGRLYYTMKLVRGKTLHDTLKQRKSLEERLKLLPHFESLCQAIAYAHSRGVIHRDIKPANVMLGEFGETVLLDWGIAKIKSLEDVSEEKLRENISDLNKERPLEDLEAETKAGMRLGTPHYMAPEQARGDVASVDERSDVYALGSVLYELLTGKTPFSGKTTHEILQKVVHSNPVSVLKTVSDAPPELVMICEKAMRKESAERYQTAVELAEDIQRFINGSLVRAYNYSMKEILSRYYRKHRAMVNTVAAFAVALMVVGIYSYVSIVQSRNRERAQREVAERQGYLTQLGLMQAAIEARDYFTANKVAEQTLPSQRGWEWSYLLNRANPELRTVMTPQGDRICAIAYAPDGTVLATASDEGTVALWDSETGGLKCTCEGQAVLSSSGRFSPDGKWLAGACLEGTVRVWATDSGKRVHTLSGHKDKALWAEFTPDGNRIISASLDGTARIWNVHSGETVATLDAGAGPLYKVACAPNGKDLALMSDEGQTVVFEMPGNVRRFICEGREAVFSPDGKWLATCGKDFTALWDTATGSEIQRWTVPEQTLIAVHFSSDASRLLTAGKDGIARLYEIASWKELRQFDHGTSLREAAFSHNGSVIITCAYDNTFAAWEAASGFLLNRMAGQGRFLWGVDFTHDGSRMLTSSNEEYFQVWDPLYQTGRRFLTACAPRTDKLAVCEKTQQMAALGANGAAHVLSYAKADNHDIYTANPVLLGQGSLALSENGLYLAAVLDTFSAVVWNLSSHDVLHLLKHDSRITHIAFDPAGQRLATACENGTVHLWDLALGKPLHHFDAHTGSAFAVCFSPDGRYLASGGMDGKAILWNLADGAQAWSIQAHKATIKSVAFSPDGKRLLTASDDRTACVWEAATGKGVAVLQGHNNGVYDVSMEARNRYILTSSSDRSTRIWDAVSFELLIRLPEVTCARFCASTKTLVTVSSDGHAECWEAFDPDAKKHPGPLQPKLGNFKRAHYRQSEVNAPVAPQTVKVILSKETLGAALRNLAQTLSAEQAAGMPETDTSGLLAASEPRWESLLPLGLEPGDSVVQFNAQPLRSRTEALAALQPLTTRDILNLPDTLDVRLERHGQPLRMSITAQSRESCTQTLQLSRKQSIALLGRMKDDLVLSLMPEQGLDSDPLRPYVKLRSNVVPVSGQQTSPAQGTVHVVLEHPIETTPGEYPRAAGLALMDRLTAMDGVGFSSLADAMQRLEKLREAVENNTAAAFNFSVQRGEFQGLQLDYTITP